MGNEENLVSNLPNVTPVRRGGSRTASDNEKAFGYMPYKYCASTEESASYRVSLEIKGKTIGAQGEAFMNFFRNCRTSTGIHYFQMKTRNFIRNHIFS